MLVSKKLLSYFLDFEKFSNQEIIDGIIGLGIDFEKVIPVFPKPPKNKKPIIVEIIDIQKHKDEEAFELLLKVSEKKALRLITNQLENDFICFLNEKVILLIDNDLNISDFKNEDLISGLLATYSNCQMTYHEIDKVMVVNKDLKLGSKFNFKSFEDLVFIFLNPSNRPDLNAVFVLSQELAVKLNYKFSFEKDLFQKKTYKNSLKPIDARIKVKDCLEGCFQTFSLEKNHNSCLDLQVLLLNNGIVPNNFIADIVTLATFIGGCPFQIYDYDKINFPLEINLQKSSKNLLTLKKKTTNLQNGIVVNDKEKTIALGGLETSYETGINLNSRNFLIQFLNLNFLKVKDYFDFHNKVTNSILIKPFSYSYHFNLTKACFLFILNKLTPQKKLSINKPSFFYYLDNKPKEEPPIKISLNLAEAERIISLKLDPKELKLKFKKLGFKINLISKNPPLLEFIPPNNRLDLTNSNDIIEEIIRFMIDLNDVPVQQPDFKFIQYPKNKEQSIANQSINFWTANNFTETIHYSLISDNLIDINLFSFFKKLNVKNQNINKHYRLSPFASLFQTLVYNLSNQNNLINLFEVCDIYYQEKDKSIQKNLVLGTISYGEWIGSFNPKKILKVDIFQIKAILKSYFLEINLESLKLSYHPFSKTNQPKDLQITNIFKNGILVYYGTSLIGIIGQVMVSKILTDKLNLFHYPVIYSEFNLSKINSLKNENKNNIKLFSSFSQFPAIKRDFSFLVDLNDFDKPITGAEILNKIQTFLSSETQYKFEIQIIDVFYLSDDKSKVSYSIRITFEPDKSTFIKEEIQNLESIVLQILTERLKYKVR